MTSPNVRSELGTAASSRTKLSWVDCAITTADKSALDAPRALSAGNTAVAGFFSPVRKVEFLAVPASPPMHPERFSVRHDLGDAEQHDRRQEKQIDIGFDLAVAAQQADIGDGLLAQRRLRAAFGDQRDETPRLGFQPLDALEEIERPYRRCRAQCAVDQH